MGPSAAVARAAGLPLREGAAAAAGDRRGCEALEDTSICAGVRAAAPWRPLKRPSRVQLLCGAAACCEGLGCRVRVARNHPASSVIFLDVLQG